MAASIICLTGGNQFEAEPDITILDAARKGNITLEYSCKTGRCGACKVKVPLGTTRALTPEACITAEESNEGWILTCCRAATTDLTLDLEDLSQLSAHKIKTLPCRIDSLEHVSSDVVNVRLRLPPNANFSYLPGQYIDVIGPAGARRSYSIANHPRADGKLELHIRKVPGGTLSQYWFEDAQVNDLLRLEGPLGTFFLRDLEAKSIIFLATGTGIAPVKAMLEAIQHSPADLSGKEIKVYWGGRKPEDIYWTPPQLKDKIQWIPVLSRLDSNWDGRQGYVQEAFLSEARDLMDTVIYACGSDAMIHSARAAVASQGFNVRKFFSDAFVSSN